MDAFWTQNWNHLHTVWKTEVVFENDYHKSFRFLNKYYVFLVLNDMLSRWFKSIQNYLRVFLHLRKCSYPKLIITFHLFWYTQFNKTYIQLTFIPHQESTLACFFYILLLDYLLNPSYVSKILNDIIVFKNGNKEKNHL